MRDDLEQRIRQRDNVSSSSSPNKNEQAAVAVEAAQPAEDESWCVGKKKREWQEMKLHVHVCAYAPECTY